MKLKNFLYLTQLEEYDSIRIGHWVKKNPNRVVEEVKKKLIWTLKIKTLYLIAKIFFFLPPEKSVILGLKVTQPINNLLKFFIISLATIKLRLLHNHLKIIAITGSWGKTTVKENLKVILKSKFKTAATIANKNTPIGICLAILKMPTDAQMFICEMGAYYPNDIKGMCKIVKPEVGIITAIGPMHLERFGTMDNILKTKMELAESLPASGQLILPIELKTVLTNFKVKVKDIKYFRNFPEIYSYFGKSDKNISPEHRMQIMKNGSITIIDDTYNSNPKGFELALDKLSDIPSKNRILVTPGMIELGSLQNSENKRLAKIAAGVCNYAIVVGITNKEALLSGLRNTKTKIHFVDNISQAQEILTSITTPNATILFENDLPDNYF